MNEKTTETRQASSDRLADAIASDIQSGELAPGLWLKQIDIEQRYGATRNVARNTLQKLAMQRYIEHAPNRGYRVPMMDERKRHEWLRIRVALEVLVVPEIVANATEQDIEELREQAIEFRDLVPGGEFLRLVAVNTAFHARMQLLSDNREAIRMIDDLREMVHPSRGMLWDSHARIQQSAQEHLDMVEALALRDTDALTRLVAAHVGRDAIKQIRVVEFEHA